MKRFLRLANPSFVLAMPFMTTRRDVRADLCRGLLDPTKRRRSGNLQRRSQSVPFKTGTRCTWIYLRPSCVPKPRDQRPASSRSARAGIAMCARGPGNAGLPAHGPHNWSLISDSDVAGGGISSYSTYKLPFKLKTGHTASQT